MSRRQKRNTSYRPQRLEGGISQCVFATRTNASEHYLRTNRLMIDIQEGLECLFLSRKGMVTPRL